MELAINFMIISCVDTEQLPYDKSITAWDELPGGIYILFVFVRLPGKKYLRLPLSSWANTTASLLRQQRNVRFSIYHRSVEALMAS